MVKVQSNIIKRGNCESNLYPTTGDSILISDCIFIKGDSFTFNHSTGDSYLTNRKTIKTDYNHSSYKFTKTTASEGYIVLGDTSNLKKSHFASSMLRAGHKYTAEIWIYIPTVSGITGSQISWAIKKSVGGAWVGDSVRAANTLDAWQKVVVKSTLTGDSSAFVRLAAVAAATTGSYFYCDDIALYEY